MFTFPEYITIPLTRVRANCSLRIQLISEKGPFQLKNIEVLKGYAEGFLVTDIIIERNFHFVSGAGFPAEYFEYFGHLDDLAYTRLERGRSIIIEIKNTTDKELTFAGLLRGEIKDDSKDVSNKKVIAGLGSLEVDGSLKVHLQFYSRFKPKKIFIPEKILDNLNTIKVKITGREVETSLIDGVLNLHNDDVMEIMDWFSIELEQKTPMKTHVTGVVIGEVCL